MEYMNLEKIQEVLNGTEFKVEDYLELIEALDDEKSKLTLFYRILLDNTKDLYYKLMLEKSMYYSSNFFDIRDKYMYDFINYMLEKNRYKRMYI